MQEMRYNIEVMIRIMFFLFAIQMIMAFGWIAPYKSTIYNSFYLLFIVILFYIAFSAIENSNKKLYGSTSAVGLCFSAYFTYEHIYVFYSSPLASIVIMLGFIILLSILFTQKNSVK